MKNKTTIKIIYLKLSDLPHNGMAFKSIQWCLYLPLLQHYHRTEYRHL